MATLTIEQALQTAAAFEQAGRIEEAKNLFRQVLQVQPNRAEAWHALGVIALRERRMEEAEQLIARAVAAASGNAAAESDLGVARSQLGRFEEAVECFRRALAAQPARAHVHGNLGDALAALGRDDEAVESYQRAVEAAPGYGAAHNNLGNIHFRNGRLAEAAACFRAALQLEPGAFHACINLGDVLAKLGHLDEAIAVCQRAIALQPDVPFGHQNLGAAWWRKGDYAQARACFERAIALDPEFADVHLGLAFIHLLEGRFSEGWRKYEWRWLSRTHAALRRSFSAPRWDGRPIPGGTLLIHAEQGFGDTLHFLRYVPLAARRSGAARVVVECQRELVRLVSSAGGAGVEFHARGRHDDAGLPPFDVHVPLLSLPLLVEHFEPLPATAPYLTAPPHLRAAWRERLAATPGFRIGIVWSGNPEHRDDRLRTIQPSQLLALLPMPGASFYSLQIESRGALPESLARAGVHDLTDHITDFADTAALMAELDLIITVDTAAAHLAGALGRPVWTLLPFVPDWRWGLGRAETPWYSTMRLFRQQQVEEWAPVIAELRERLHQLILSNQSTPRAAAAHFTSD